MNNRREYNSNQKGSITVFLLIILFTIVSFIFVLIDTTRIYSARNQFIVASNNAAKSAMANYNAELFNQYGLFAYNSSDAKDIAEEVFNKNINANYGNGSSGLGSVLSLRGAVAVTEAEMLFGGTDTFKKQMIYAMKYQGTENLAINVYERLVGLIEAAKQASISEDMEEIDEALGELKKELGGVENAKLSAQKAIIALILANNTPKFYYIDKYIKSSDFDPQIGNDQLLNMVNDSIGELYFNGGLADEDDEYLEYPIQNIYIYYYALHMAKCYERGYVEEYEKAKEQYEKDLEEYNSDLEQYNKDKEEYKRTMEEYEVALDEYEKKLEEYEKNKNNPGFQDEEPEKPQEPDISEPEEPTKPDEPTILKDDIDDFKKMINKFCEKINSEINDSLEKYFEKDSKYMGYYIDQLEEGLDDLSSLISEADKRNKILSMASDLETKINEISINEKVKEEVQAYIDDVRKVLNEETLCNLQVDLSDIKSIIKGTYMPELWKNYGAASQNADSVKQHIEGLINSSTDKIAFDNVEVVNFINSIKNKYSFGTFSSNNILEIIKQNFSQGSRLVSYYGFTSFRKTLSDWHKGINISEHLNSSSINKDNLDIGKRNSGDDIAEEVGDKLDDEKDKDKDSKSLKMVLEALDSNESISDIVFSAGGSSGVKAAGELTELQGYSDAFGNEDYPPSLLDNIYLTEYIMTNFKDLVDYEKYGTAANRTPKETEHEAVLEYEIEAIINGKFDDQENKESMTTFVKSFRIACNVITIYKTQKMRDFTEKAARRICAILSAAFNFFPWGGTAISAAIRSEPFKKITQAGLILGWANMEANLDTSDIFRGFYVPLIKDGNEWIMNLGLQLGGNAGEGNAGDNSVENALNNMDEPQKEESEPYNTQPTAGHNTIDMVSYGDILRARLLIKLIANEDSVISGTKELVNANMKNLPGDFDFSTYYSAMKISVDSSVNTWFSNESFSSGGRVNFKKFEYIKRYN